MAVLYCRLLTVPFEEGEKEVLTSMPDDTRYAFVVRAEEYKDGPRSTIAILFLCGKENENLKMNVKYINSKYRAVEGLILSKLDRLIADLCTLQEHSTVGA